MGKSNKDTLAALFLVCPETGERQKISEIRGSEAGLDHLEITTRGKSTAWKHRIYTTEV